MLNDKSKEQKIYLVRILFPDGLTIEGAYSQIDSAIRGLEELDESVFSCGIQEITLNKKVKDEGKGFLFEKRGGVITPFNKDELFF